MTGLIDYFRIYRARGWSRLKDELAENFSYDFRMNVDTQDRKVLGDYSIDSNFLTDSVQYQPAYTSVIRKTLSLAYDRANQPCSFVDYGCGKGKVLLEALRYDFTSIVGIEIDSELCAIARDNISSFKGAKPFVHRTEVVTGDVREFEPAEDTGIVFLFNPFGIDTLTQVRDRLETCAIKNGRKIIVIYVNSEHERLFLRWQPVHKLSKYMQDTIIYEFHDISS